MSLRQVNALKHTRHCLKCGRRMWTDRCHRICTRCSHRNERLLEPRVALPQEARRLLREITRGPLRSLAAPLEN